MRKSYLYLTISIGVLFILLTGMHSCTRINGINNDQVVETPFSLFFADTAGAVYNSTDGKTIKKIIFEADAYPVKAICVTGDNILLVKSNVYISINNGSNFNHSYDSAASYPGIACNGFPFDLNQSMIIDIPAWGKTYVANHDDYVLNYIGVSGNQFSGAQGDWWIEGSDTFGDFGHYSGDPRYTIRVTSMTLMTNGILAAYDAHSNRNFYKTQNNPFWNECSPAASDPVTWPGIGNAINPSGTPLPHHDIFVSPGVPIDTTARYSYGHIKAQLIAIDQPNCYSNGAYYSIDTGRNWTPFIGGLPSKPLLCIESPFEDVCLIGTAGAGLYMLNTNTNKWQANNNGLLQNLVVRSIVGKTQIYKNGKTVKYIFLATNAGIYESTDDGANFTLTIPGNYTAIY